MTNKYFTGIGSRETPLDILDFMYYIGYWLAKSGYILRSGGADGADTYFEAGFDEAQAEKEIFLPWPGFNGHTSSLCHQLDGAKESVKKLHPTPKKLTPGAWKLHARNVHQVLGRELTEPSKFVICWTKSRGGTQQAIRVANYFGVPVYNLIKDKDFNEIRNHIRSLRWIHLNQMT